MNDIHGGCTLPKTRICGDFEAMSRQCAELVCTCIGEHPNALLCLPAGASAIRTYELLSEMVARGEADFSCTRFVQLDEWLNLEDESENCSAFLKKHFYGPLGIAEERVESFRIHESDLENECRRMDAYICEQGPIELMLLGIGMNGHLGLNEPGVPWNRWSVAVELDSITASVGQKYFTENMKLRGGITLGMKHLFAAKKVVLQAGGESKAEIVSKMYTGGLDFNLPATVLYLVPNATVVLDEAAASLLDEETRKSCL